jgi:hypothetical protein
MAARLRGLATKEHLHKLIDELSDDGDGDGDGVEVFYKISTERRKHEEPGLALRAAFVEMYRTRRDAPSASD